MTTPTSRILFLWALLAVVPTLGAQDRVTTLAGRGLVAGGANGISTNALFNDPAAIVTDAGGNLYVADNRNHAIRRIDTNGVVTTFAGRLETPGSSDGTGFQAAFDSPSGIAMDPAGNLFVSDTGNHTLRIITSAGVVTTLAGMPGQSGFADGVGLSARFNSPLGVVVAPNGTVFVADCGNHLIRVIPPDGEVTTLAGTAETWGSDDGTGGAARFNGPVGLALDAEGNLFVSDSNNHTIRRVTPDGSVTTWAGLAGVDGSRDGDRLAARFAKPAELAFDRHGNLFVADSFNHVIRRISTDGRVDTVAGRAGEHGVMDGVNGQARLFNPYGLAVAPDGSLVVADAYNELIREVFVPFRLAIHATNGGGGVLSWDSVIGTKYQVQYRGTRPPAVWTHLDGPVTASMPGTTHIHLPDNPGGQKIYRVLVVP